MRRCCPSQGRSSCRSRPAPGRLQPPRACRKLSCRSRAAELLQPVADTAGMTAGPHVIHRHGDVAFRVDDEGGTDDSFNGVTEDRLLTPGAVLLRDRKVRVAGQREVEAVRGAELLTSFQAV